MYGSESPSDWGPQYHAHWDPQIPGNLVLTSFRLVIFLLPHDLSDFPMNPNWSQTWFKIIKYNYTTYTTTLTVASYFVFYNRFVVLEPKNRQKIFSEWTTKQFRKKVAWEYCPNSYMFDWPDKFLNFRPTLAQTFGKKFVRNFIASK